LAIYQYHITLIPRQSLVDKFGTIPNKLTIDNAAWTKHWDKADINADYDFEDAMNILWWIDRQIPFKTIEPFIDSFTKLVDWSKNSTDYKSYGDNDTNDFSIGLTNDDCIEDFGCRLDLRELDRSFIDNILSLAKQLDCLLMDKQGNLFEPTFDKLVDSIKQSNSFKFVSNPTDFLDKLSNGLIQPE
jgi:hypothetical protein